MHVIVLGAGIAGSLIAEKLATNSSYKITVVDQAHEAATKTSDHQLALVHPQVNKKSTKLQRFTQIANRLIWQKFQSSLRYPGVYQPNFDVDVSLEKLSELLLTLSFDPLEITPLDSNTALEKINLQCPGLWFNTAGIYDLKKISCEAIQTLKNQQHHWGEKIIRIQKNKGLWELINSKNETVCAGDALILATNFQTKELLKTIDIELPLRPVRGQLSRFIIPKQSQVGKCLPKTVMRGDGYCSPATEWDDDHWLWEVGSSYEEDNDCLTPSQQSAQANQKKGLLLIGLNNSEQKFVEHSNFVGLRSASKDRLPLIGPVHEHPGLFLATAYGSRGLIWATLGAELIHAYLAAFFAGTDFLAAGFLTATFAETDLTGLESELASSVSPARFFAGALTARASNSKPTFPSGLKAK
ncbi:tRNA 5-methylaminomethyl-2-thiouridine biosynthesis bifunctional protein [Polynucleobacter kasalickyi]|uniref:tRNA 5-methylaminomethyl-2-thiouridine biosynthesis bifunctional protein n=1 Tax=Polynucleobacter kasalickyi TaxID=1938817 RepID=A0A1W2BRN4_9BURK|nr:tRNA 5-methylaminomethyl-2-thiouridine biosynthesis bifunctional protein [Polynucleobacter kasalickyi]